MRFTIKRTHLLSEGTFGVLDCDGIPFAVSIELPWRDNQQDISCIPTGMYICKRIDSPKFKETFEVQSVPNRTHVLLHKANTISDLHGCIGIGLYFGQLTGQVAVLESGRAFANFLLKVN